MQNPEEKIYNILEYEGGNFDANLNTFKEYGYVESIGDRTYICF